MEVVLSVLELIVVIVQLFQIRCAFHVSQYKPYTYITIPKRCNCSKNG
jgi:hypothetical protein